MAIQNALSSPDKKNGLKIDFILWSIGILQNIIQKQQLPDELDVGYTVLIDKNDLTEGLKSPTHRAHIPSPPSQADYQERTEEFFHEATYVAKNLWRGDLIFAKYNLDYAMKARNLLPMLEWKIEIERNWSLKPGLLGKGLKKIINPQLWKELEDTYTGADEEENWKALFSTIALFRKIAVLVGEHFSYPYPYDLEERVTAYLLQVKKKPRKLSK
jgi:aminoglycoside 6-adenylyltransferase